MRPGMPAPEAQRTFTLGKRWRVAVRPENVVVRIAMTPEGAAARLREETQQIIMPRVQVFTAAQLAQPWGNSRPRLPCTGSGR